MQNSEAEKASFGTNKQYIMCHSLYSLLIYLSVCLALLSVSLSVCLSVCSFTYGPLRLKQKNEYSLSSNLP